MACPNIFQLYFSCSRYGKRVRKLSVVVEGTFMYMCDFLLPHNRILFPTCNGNKNSITGDLIDHAGLSFYKAA
jgi:hypothetical protein